MGKFVRKAQEIKKMNAEKSRLETIEKQKQILLATKENLLATSNSPSKGLDDYIRREVKRAKQQGTDYSPEITSINGAPIIKKTVTRVSDEVADQVKKEYDDIVKPQFMKFLAETHRAELEALEIPEDQIALMYEKGRVPRGFSVHHKLERTVGGTNDFSNLILIPDGRHHELNEYLLDAQTDVKIRKPGETFTIAMPDFGDACIYSGPMYEGNVTLHSGEKLSLSGYSGIYTDFYESVTLKDSKIKSNVNKNLLKTNFARRYLNKNVR